MTKNAWAVRRYSHWQGGKNPGEVVAVLATQQEADNLAEALSTCSFCSPGKVAKYAVGQCYKVRKTTRYPVGYGLDTIEESVLEDCGISSNSQERS